MARMSNLPDLRTTPMKCPECGEKMLGSPGLASHRRAQHGIVARQITQAAAVKRWRRENPEKQTRHIRRNAAKLRAFRRLAMKYRDEYERLLKQELAKENGR